MSQAISALHTCHFGNPKCCKGGMPAPCSEPMFLSLDLLTQTTVGLPKTN